MQHIDSPASTGQEHPVYHPPCADLWDTVFPAELLALQHV